MPFSTGGIAWLMKLRYKAQGLNRPAISETMQRLSKARSFSYTGSHLRKKKSVCEKHYCFPHSTINATHNGLFNGYFSIVNNPASFGTHRTGGVFVDNDVVVCSHYDSGTIIAADVEQQLHDLIGSFGIEVTGRLIGQNQLG